MTTSHPQPALTTNTGDPAAQATTPGQAKAAYKAARRAAATAAGRPIPRAKQPGCYLAAPVGTFVFIEGGRLLEVDFSLAADLSPATLSTVAFGETALPVPPSRQPVPLTFDRLSQIVRDAYEADVRPGAVTASAALAAVQSGMARTVLIADKATLTAMTRLADAAAKSLSPTTDQSEAMLVRAVSRTLNYRAGLPHSAFLPILTTALAARFWMQVALDETSLDEWADGFGVGRNALRDKVAFLLAAALDGPSNVKYVKGMLTAEKYGSLSSQYGSTTSQSKAFRYANAAASSYAAITNTDPLLAEFNMLSGEVARIRIVKKNDSTFTATLSDPFKVKPGRSVLLFDADSDVGSTSEATLSAVDFVKGSDSLLGKFSRGKRHHKTWWLAEEAHKNHRPLFVVEVPFVGAGRAVKLTGRWSNRDEQATTITGRDVPVDVALAGMPMAD